MLLRIRPIAWLCVAPMEFGFDPLLSRSEPRSCFFMPVSAPRSTMPSRCSMPPQPDQLRCRHAAALVTRLGELGWIDGRTIAIEYRWSEGRTERYAEIAAEFVRRKVDVIVTVGSAVPKVKEATTVIPIVFAVGIDPVASGLVASLAKPGGNVTGLSIQAAELVSKRLEILREIVP